MAGSGRARLGVDRRHTERGEHGRDVRAVVVSSQEICTWSAVGGVQVDPGPFGRGHDVGGPPGTSAATRVEERVGGQLDAAGTQPGGERRWRARGYAGRYRRKPVRAVVDRVHAGDHGKQHLRGTDVAGRLLPADVLLAGLQREPVGRGAIRVPAHSDSRPGSQRSSPARTAR